MNKLKEHNTLLSAVPFFIKHPQIVANVEISFQSSDKAYLDSLIVIAVKGHSFGVLYFAILGTITSIFV